MVNTTKVLATGINNIDALLLKNKWASTSISFGFTDTFADYGSKYPGIIIHASTFRSLNDTQRLAARNWFKQYASVSLLTPFELSGASDRDATIRLAMSGRPRTAYGGYPTTARISDAWFNREDYNNPQIGDFAYHTFGHEIGHTLGLKHAHEAQDGVRDVVMDFDRDSMEFTIMTYRSYIGQAIGTYTVESGGFAQSLMMYDILAIQKLYGANFAYNAGDTTYTFSTATGEMFVNGAGQGQPTANRIFRTVWDGGGNDTYDFSNYTTNLSISLEPGEWTDLDVNGGFQRAKLNTGGSQSARGHVFNALLYNFDFRSMIENANGGSGNDTLRGTRLSNRLNGNGGNDWLYGELGTDIVLGGSGNDVIVEDETYTDTDSYDGGEGIDWLDCVNLNIPPDIFVVIDLASGYLLGDGVYKGPLKNIEHVSGSEDGDIIVGATDDNILLGITGDDTLSGNAGNDTLKGGLNNDKLSGDAGADFLDGGVGNDEMNGGSGIDEYIVDSLGDVIVEQASTSPDDYDTVIAYVDNYTLAANVEALTLSDDSTSSAINATGNSLNNAMMGNRFSNKLQGADGDDILRGGVAGNDLLDGGGGNDFLASGGSDILTGGTGKDTFKFFSAIQGIDTITDFVAADDVIDVDNFGFKGGLTPYAFITADQFRTGANAQDSSDRFIYNQSTGALYFDSDGVGGTNQTQFAKLSTNLTLTNQDIYVSSFIL